MKMAGNLQWGREMATETDVAAVVEMVVLAHQRGG